MGLASAIAIISDLGGRRCQTIMPYPTEAMMEGTDITSRWHNTHYIRTLAQVGSINCLYLIILE